MTKPIRKVKATLGFSTSKMDGLTAGARNIYTKMSADVQHFPSPVPSMPTYLGLITSLESAQPAVASRTKGAVGPRNNAARALVSGTKHLLSYVQTVADASLDSAETIIVAAGFTVATDTQHVKAPVTLKIGPQSGTVLAYANVAFLVGSTSKSVSYSWMYSVDGQKTWVSLPVTPISRTIVTGIAPMTTVAVRVAVTVGTAQMSDWSQVSTLFVQQ